jgi:polar amino acid transport system permease protein
MTATATNLTGPAPRAGPVAADDAANAVPRGRALRWTVTAAVSLAIAYVVAAAALNQRFEWDVVARYFFSTIVIEGLYTSLYLTAVLLVFGIVLGTLVALARMSSYVPLQALSWGYTWVFRAVPALVQLILWFNLAYLVPQIVIGIPFGPEFARFNTNDVITPFVAAVLGLGLCEAAYMAEVIRAGLSSVDKGQTDAARAIGLTRWQTFMRIVLPQSMRFILPPLGSQAILLLKATSLVSVIALSDLLHSVQTIYNRTLEVIPLLMVATLWYLILVSILSLGQIALERHFSRSFATRTATAAPEGASQ